MAATYYPAIIDRSADGFGVSFPDFPGCVAAGATVNEAALNGEAALAMHVEAMVKDKDALPAPSDLDAIEEVEGADDVARLLIRVDAPPKIERVLISLDSGLLRAIDAVAVNRSAWMAEAARAALREDQRRAASPIGLSLQDVLGQGNLPPGIADSLQQAFQRIGGTEIDQSFWLLPAAKVTEEKARKALKKAAARLSDGAKAERERRS